MRWKSAIVSTLGFIAFASVGAHAKTTSCPTDKPLLGVEVITGPVTNPRFPNVLGPDQVVATPYADPQYTKETHATWTHLDEAPKPIVIECRYSNGSSVSFTLPTTVTRCDMNEVPPRSMACK